MLFKLQHFPLFHVPMLLITWVTFAATAFISFCFQHRRGGGDFRIASMIGFAFPKAMWKTKSARTDIVVYAITQFTRKINFGISAVFTVAISQLVLHIAVGVFPHHHIAQISARAMIAWCLVIFIVVDFSAYLSHFLQHFVPVLWELHKCHHSARFLNPLTTHRMHPLGDSFDGLVAAILISVPIGAMRFLYSLGIPESLLMYAIANMIGTVLILDALRHSQFAVSFGKADRILLSPHMHQLHHSHKVEHWDKNFGTKLSVWDWWFGTMFRPAKDEEIPYGTGKPEDDDYNTLTGFYFGPAIKIFRLISGNENRHHDSMVKKRFFERVVWRSPVRNTAIDAAPDAPDFNIESASA